MTTIDERFEEMQPAFDDAAASIIKQISDRGFAEYMLTPGDATTYPFILLPPNRLTDSSGGGHVRKHWLVILAMQSYGGSYEWAGQSMHWDYCASKWCENNHPWTGRVVASLLNAVSTALQPEEPTDEDGPMDDDWIHRAYEAQADAKARRQTASEMMLEDLRLEGPPW